MSIIAAVIVTCFLFTWSRGSADDVIVSTTWLYEHLSSVMVIEATYNVTCLQSNVEHISGASLWDLRQCSWSTSARPLDDPDELCAQQYARSLGLDTDKPIVIYDRTGMQDAARLWWTMLVLGRENVAVLDGGWTAWTEHQLPTSRGRFSNFYNDVRGDWVAKYNASWYRDLVQMTVDVRTAQRQIVDARFPEHFRGDDVEPNPITINALISADVTLCQPMLRGHMMSAVNVPAPSVIDPESRLLLDRCQLLSLFQTAGVDVDLPLTTTSYVGSAACLVALAAVHCGARDVAVYTGSWTEWSQMGDSRLTVRGDDRSVLGGECPRQWMSQKEAFMDVAVAHTRRITLECDEQT